MAEEMTAREAVYQAVAEAMKVDVSTLTDETQPIADLKATSVDFVHITKFVEDAFDASVPFMKFRRNKTMGEMVEFIEEIVGEE